MTESQARLVTDNLALAYWAARRWHRGVVARRLSLDDAEAAALLGLVEAARRFDPARGVRFSTYALHWCKSRVWGAACAAGGAVSVPTMRPVLPASRRAWRRALAPAGRPWGDQAGGDRVAAGLERADDLARLGEVLAALPPRERVVLRLRAAGASLAEVGRRLGVSRERVRQIEARALAHARRAAGVRVEGGAKWR